MCDELHRRFRLLQHAAPSLDICAHCDHQSASPDIFVCGAGSMGGLVTTVEGLLEQIIAALRGTQTFQLGDSASALDRSTWGAFFQKLEDCMALKQSWTLRLTDPLSNSFIAPCNDSPDTDPRLTCEDYERTAEEDEEYGIDHLKKYAGEGLNMNSIDLS